MDAIVGGNGPSIRDVARLYPTVPFVATFWDEQEITLREPVANVYRFEDRLRAEHGRARGLCLSRPRLEAGERPRRRRHARLGGCGGLHRRVLLARGQDHGQVCLSPFVPQKDPAAQALRSRPDGVAVLLTSFDSPVEAIRGVLRGVEQPSRQLLLNGPLIEDPSVLQPVAVVWTGSSRRH